MKQEPLFLIDVRLEFDSYNAEIDVIYQKNNMVFEIKTFLIIGDNKDSLSNLHIYQH